MAASGIIKNFVVLFEKRALVAEMLKACIRDKGYSKASFGRKIDISGPTLDKILSGTVENKSTFEKYLHKVLRVLGITSDMVCLWMYWIFVRFITRDILKLSCNILPKFI